MVGAVHPAEPIWVNGRAVMPAEIHSGDVVDSFDSKGPRRGRVEKTRQGGGKGTVWLHGASGACVRCLHDERVAVFSKGRRSYRRADAVQPGEFLVRLVQGKLTVDPIVATRTVTEPVAAIYLEMPSVALVTEEGVLCRPAS
jgi:hypothetical protein